MTQEELDAFTAKLAELTEHGTEEEVREYVSYHYPRLPEDMRNDMLFDTMLGAIKDEVREAPVIADLQEKGITAAEVLEQMRESVEREAKEGEKEA